MQLFLLLFLLIREAVASSVPGCRGDRDKDHRSRENCTGAGFTDIPAGLEHKTQVLLFPYNLFSTLSWTSFQIFTEIYEIDLTANKVPEVSPGSGPILPGLSVLRLGSNRLTFLHDGSFTACPALTELYLENNSITSLTDQTFSGLSKLEILDLTSNHISILPGLMLHPLPAIETLYLETNQIKVMPDGWFSQKEEVPYLYLSENPWTCSCSLGYLRRYLEDYEANVYVRDGLIISSDVDSVVCDSPQRHQGKPVITLEESDLCSPSAAEPEPPGDVYQPMTKVFLDEMTSVPSVDLSTPEPTLHTSSVAPTAPSTPEPTTTEHMTSAFPELPAQFRVVTRSWYQTFTSLLEWSYRSRSEIKTERSFVGLFVQTTHPIPMTSRPSTTPFTTTTNVPSTGTSATLQMIPAAATTGTTSTTGTALVSNQSVGIRQLFKVTSAGGGAVFCVWLFAGCLLLCMSSAALVLVTVVRLIIWYKKVYKPLSLTVARRKKGGEGVALLLKNKREENAVAGDGGVVALYRSLLFVNREGGDMVEGEERNKGQIITLKLTGGEETGDRRGPEDGGVHRKTMYRLFSREEEIEGWREVVEECRVSAEDGGRKREIRRHEEPTGGAGGVTKKRYSVILREEREEAGGGVEELDWVVGGWEVKRGAEGGPRSSWGRWLAENVPSMPWGLSAPSEEEAAAE
ncbi:platelet glycoprotein Ib alpha chain-like [Girardinichthys multiradiatus]|uniref:platelet glycoprotein Ib alpha chain-like n=1 Tax=Girardinichthys multiradiatus TaxID=208333 RepID=UPI001FAC73F2|nr:platelet glycoprotein Ib alpha chain-like [Girardinichthys multiradiatus]